MSEKGIRVRFAPSPTGALHIGGIRTALYNFLFARKFGGTFILRIEDTDQNRYVSGAEAYIIEALKWVGLQPDEGPGFGGQFSPYRQSERQAIYGQYAQQLLDSGHAYYAFDTPEQLAEAREKDPTFKYDAQRRMHLQNSLTLPPETVEEYLAKAHPFVVRLKVPTDKVITIEDQIRGTVQFQSNELDDKVMLKGDGMPTYHLANVVDDYLMQISHVIRGEEWLPSTAHHVLLYQFLGWESQMPSFAHLPLILKPDGNGKLSKRDGTRLGIPVFPLAWHGETPEDSFTGFREEGFLPSALINFLAFLGWSPGTDQELFDLSQLVEAFDIANISKSGARFDIDKARWFNQQYILHASDEFLFEKLTPMIQSAGWEASSAYTHGFIRLMKERCVVLTDFIEKGAYFFEPIKEYDAKMVQKKWKSENAGKFEELSTLLFQANPFTAEQLEKVTKDFMESTGLKAGDVMPILRLALSGTMQGPGVFEMMELFGPDTTKQRMGAALAAFHQLVLQNQ